jgi:hypothetical protein
VEEADGPGRGLRCAPAAHNACILAARRELSELASDLAERRDASPEAKRLATTLAHRGCAPLFTFAGARQMLADARLARELLVAGPAQTAPAGGLR